MKITLIQTRLAWEQPEKNRAHFGQLINSISENTDLIILPEMFTTGFTMAPEKNAEPAEGATLAWMREMATKKKAVICGSVSVAENKKFYNRLYWVEPQGSYKTYDKRHLFRMADEDQHYTAGNKKLITELKGWKLCPLVCYDLRFPVWSRNRFKNGSWDYDVLIYVANWPAVRAYPWKQLLIARAIENQCYVIGLNRIGEDGNGYDHSGDSLVIGPKGEVLSAIPPSQENVFTISLDKTSLEEFRTKFPAGLDADDFEIKF